MSFKEVTALRKNGQLDEAYKLALQDLQEELNAWSISAMFWVLNDLCKTHISKKENEQIHPLFEEMVKLADQMDDYEGYAGRALTAIRKQINPKYRQLTKASNLSKEGLNEEALKIFKEVSLSGDLEQAFHESYGWIIYRYLSNNLENLSSIQARSLLRDYIILQNERPSQLHSLFLNLATKISEHFSDFKLLSFIKLWGVRNFTREDYHTQTFEGKEIKSLVVRILQKLVKNDTNDIDDILVVFKNSEFNEREILDALREPYYWNIYSCSKNKSNSLWLLYNSYVTKMGKYQGSIYHSKILESAWWSMQENEEWRFLTFSQKWGIENFIDCDWNPVIKDNKAYDSLITKTIDKLFNIFKQNDYQKAEDYTILLKKASLKYPQDYQLKRKYAILLSKSNKFSQAIDLYKELVISLNEWYVWYEFSQLISDIQLKFSFLSKILLMQSMEDFIGYVRLSTAECLIELHKEKEAATELIIYKKHRLLKGWSIPKTYTLLEERLNISETNKDNKQLYEEYAYIAEEYAYSNIATTTMTLVAIFNDKTGKPKCKFINTDSSIAVVVSPNKFYTLKKIAEGDIFECKLNEVPIEDGKEEWMYHNNKKYKNIPLLIKKTQRPRWSDFILKYGYIEYINIDKRILHIITTESEEIFAPFKNESFQRGTFVSFRLYSEVSKDEKRNIIKHIQICQKENIITYFPNRIVAIDEVNNSKELFHIVSEVKQISAIIHFDETTIHPKVGELLSLYYLIKKDKNNNRRLLILQLESSMETNTKLVKEIKGRLELKCKNGIHQGNCLPEADFGFVENCYVSKSLIEKYNIKEDCEIRAKAVLDGEKWKVFEIF